MAAIIRALPFFRTATHVVVGNTQERVLIKPFQIALWASLSPRTLAGIEPDAARFPVILDTGTSHNFLISENQLAKWTKLNATSLPTIDDVWVRDISNKKRNLPLKPLSVWLHPNVPNERDVLRGLPVCLELDGVAIYPASAGPRLPVLGLRALSIARVELSIDCNRRLVWMKRPGVLRLRADALLGRFLQHGRKLLFGKDRHA